MITKINAVKDGDRILVKATFYDEVEVTEENPKGEILVHEHNTAFPLDTEKEVILEAVEKARELFELEKKQSKNQAEVDKLHEKADETIKSLTEEPKEEEALEK